MNKQLLLENIRNVLVRLEDTILFALIERAQFLQNRRIYDADALAETITHDSIVGYLLHETEKIHARMRRYTSPDEHPFYSALPEPVLPALRYDENPLKPNAVNLNDRIRTAYETEIVPYVCKPGDDRQYGSSAVCDVACLQALSKRIHYGKFVAESKYQANEALFKRSIEAADEDTLRTLITNTAVEDRVLKRVEWKAQIYGQNTNGHPAVDKINPARVVDIYRQWIIPLTKDVEIAYLLARG